jgi:hypothetical protein
MANIYNDIGNEIAKLAFEIYEKSGMVEGRCLDNWLEAERIVMAKYCAMEKQGKVKEEKPAKPAVKKPAAKKESASKTAAEKKPKTARAKKTK